MYKHSMISCIHKGKQKFKPEILFNIICNIPFHFSFSFFLFIFISNISHRIHWRSFGNLGTHPIYKVSINLWNIFKESILKYHTKIDRSLFVTSYKQLDNYFFHVNITSHSIFHKRLENRANSRERKSAPNSNSTLLNPLRFWRVEKSPHDYSADSESFERRYVSMDGIRCRTRSAKHFERGMRGVEKEGGKNRSGQYNLSRAGARFLPLSNIFAPHPSILYLFLPPFFHPLRHAPPRAKAKLCYVLARYKTIPPSLLPPPRFYCPSIQVCSKTVLGSMHHPPRITSAYFPIFIRQTKRMNSHYLEQRVG